MYCNPWLSLFTNQLNSLVLVHQLDCITVCDSYSLHRLMLSELSCSGSSYAVTFFFFFSVSYLRSRLCLLAYYRLTIKNKNLPGNKTSGGIDTYCQHFIKPGPFPQRQWAIRNTIKMKGFYLKYEF